MTLSRDFDLEMNGRFVDLRPDTSDVLDTYPGIAIGPASSGGPYSTYTRSRQVGRPVSIASGVPRILDAEMTRSRRSEAGVTRLSGDRGVEAPLVGVVDIQNLGRTVGISCRSKVKKMR